MFKNKKAVYLLIPLNIFIWGYFVFRFYTAYNHENVNFNLKDDKSFITNTNKDTIIYKLNLQYKDPFLKDNIKSKSIALTNKLIGENQPIKQSVKKVELNRLEKQIVPELKYMGLIKNTQSGVSVALVMINGQSKFVKPNDVIDGFKFKAFAQDCMLVINNKTKIVVHK